MFLIHFASEAHSLHTISPVRANFVIFSCFCSYPLPDDALSKATNGIAIIQTESSQFSRTISSETGLMEENDYNDTAPSANSTSHDRFRQAWSDAVSDPVMVEYFREKQPAEVIQEQGRQAEAFSTEPSQFSYFIYDAIQSIGLAMCKVSSSSPGPFISGPLRPHIYDQFLQTSFEGTSGQLDIDPSTGTRDAVGVTYTVWNARSTPAAKQGIVGFDLYPTTHIAPIRDFDDKGQTTFVLEQVQPFVYNDGTIQQPDTLPPPEVNLNLIGNASRTAGYVLMGIVIALGIICLLWSYLRRASRVVQASQPIFIGLVVAGCVVMSTTIIPLSMEETTVNDQSGLDVSCMARPWVSLLGFTIAFSALLTKTWSAYRVHRKLDVDSTALRPVHFFKTLGPLLFVNIVLLLSWTFVAPLQWTRVDGRSKDGFDRTIDSHANCRAEFAAAAPFALVVVLLNLGILIVANVLAYEARDVSIEYQENRYIAISMASMLQAWVLGIPLLFVVKDSPQGKFFVQVAIIFVTCSATLLLIFVPKMFAYRAERRESLDEGQRITMRNVNARIGSRTRDFDPDSTDDQMRNGAIDGGSTSDNPQAAGGVSSSAPSSEMHDTAVISESEPKKSPQEKGNFQSETSG